jgi:hypothetical protein
MEKFCLTGLPPEAFDAPGPGDSVVLQAVRSHAARCWSCRVEALCDDGQQLVNAYRAENTVRGPR